MGSCLGRIIALQLIQQAGHDDDRDGDGDAGFPRSCRASMGRTVRTSTETLIKLVGNDSRGKLILFKTLKKYQRAERR